MIVGLIERGLIEPAALPVRTDELIELGCRQIRISALQIVAHILRF
jgi:hypothetical protein